MTEDHEGLGDRATARCDAFARLHGNISMQRHPGTVTSMHHHTAAHRCIHARASRHILAHSYRDDREAASHGIVTVGKPEGAPRNALGGLS